MEKELMERSLILSLPKNVAGPSGKAFVDIYSVLRKQFPATSTWINIQGVCVCVCCHTKWNMEYVCELCAFSPHSQKLWESTVKKICASGESHCHPGRMAADLCRRQLISYPLWRRLSSSSFPFPGNPTVHPSYDQMLQPYKSCMCVLCDMVQPLCLHIANGH